MINFKLWQFIKSCQYELPFVDGDCHGEYYHTHFDDGDNHYKFGGEDYQGLIEINWACIWTLGSKDYHCNAGDGYGTYKNIELPHPFYLVVEEWEDGGSYPEYPSKVRLATSEEIAEAHKLAYEERKNRRFKAVHVSLINSNKCHRAHRKGHLNAYWHFGSHGWDGRVYQTLKDLIYGNIHLRDSRFLYNKLSESAGYELEIGEEDRTFGYTRTVMRKPTNAEEALILSRISLKEVLYDPHIKDSIQRLLEDTKKALENIQMLSEICK